MIFLPFVLDDVYVYVKDLYLNKTICFKYKQIFLIFLLTTTKLNNLLYCVIVSLVIKIAIIF